MVELGINIDHVATIRQARKTHEPDPVWAAAFAELGGADCITIHLREDRRHIIDRDVRMLSDSVNIKLNLEMATAPDIVDLACETSPDQVTLVPEKREEITTEGGLDVVTHYESIKPVVSRLQDAGISVALFLDPDPAQIEAAAKLRVQAVELHTGQYALHQGEEQIRCLAQLATTGKLIVESGINLHAGHGLNYQNVLPVAQIDSMLELNIGHCIVARAVFVGLRQAVREMKDLLS
ncbi:MAG: pyridoxine 5'-phosphate synthase [Planctomycetaceae bacterium]|jgi:pyridoxine 5-phosphate synthase|nr:pyridoxine 5'-phosphate synthase [Planctomycetaceae bacterium]MBT4723764.1 pyridoxine 5'-phosphate synthase [Planctomycetaceae bacterium]MBT4843913.1 pyridoxine 5'-phosphate synthase [Planctomycetaceae bacterium]MBT5597055.1 pyridoxine 5'-phosphate synthase [Planctomycetaceae bacterium]MBT5883575.1 pyridoxine 5'-phosphate synthase [Planctomycetaceae bacterium]